MAPRDHVSYSFTDSILPFPLGKHSEPSNGIKYRTSECGTSLRQLLPTTHDKRSSIPSVSPDHGATKDQRRVTTMSAHGRPSWTGTVCRLPTSIQRVPQHPLLNLVFRTTCLNRNIPLDSVPSRLDLPLKLRHGLRGVRPRAPAIRVRAVPPQPPMAQGREDRSDLCDRVHRGRRVQRRVRRGGFGG